MFLQSYLRTQPDAVSAAHRFLRMIVGGILFFTWGLSYAGGKDFLRIVCIPETRYFSVEYKYVEAEDALDGASRAEIKAHERAWRRHGYHDAVALNHECRLPESTYQLISRSARSRAGEVCNIALTLKWNDEVWLDGVLIGPSCGDQASLDSFEIWDGYRTQRKPGLMTLCIKDPSTAASGSRCEAFQPHPTQRHTQILTQDDLEEYVAARISSTQQGPPKGGWQRDARTLNQFLFVRYPCEFRGLQLPSDAVVHVLINGATRTLPFGIDPSDEHAYVGDVYVNAPGKRVALVMIGNSGPTVWNFYWTRSSEIAAVAAIGGSKLAFAELPKTTQVFSAHFGGGTACKTFSVSPGFPEAEKRQVEAFTRQMYHRSADTVTHFRFSSSATVGERLADIDYVQTKDFPVESFATPASELVGEKGLRKLEVDGVIRKATRRDAELWLATWKAKHPAIAKRYTVSDNELLGQITLWMAYVVQKPFRYPLRTGFSAFFIPKGAPRPTGEPGHSVLYDFNTGSCFAAPQSACQPFN